MAEAKELLEPLAFEVDGELKLAMPDVVGVCARLNAIGCTPTEVYERPRPSRKSTRDSAAVLWAVSSPDIPAPRQPRLSQSRCRAQLTWHGSLR